MWAFRSYTRMHWLKSPWPSSKAKFIQECKLLNGSRSASSESSALIFPQNFTIKTQLCIQVPVFSDIKHARLNFSVCSFSSKKKPPQNKQTGSRQSRRNPKQNTWSYYRRFGLCMDLSGNVRWRWMEANWGSRQSLTWRLGRRSWQENSLWNGTFIDCTAKPDATIKVSLKKFFFIH